MLTPIELFHANTRLAYKIAHKIAKRNIRVDPDDLAQVSLQALWQAALNFDGRGAFTTFAHHYCHGRCLAYIRDKADLVRKPSNQWASMPLQVTCELPAHLINGNQSPLEILLEREEAELDQQEFEETMEQLPWHLAFCFERKYLFGDTTKEIAQKLDISVTSVCNYLNRTYKILNVNDEDVPITRKRRA